ncbi:TIGR02302 family protein [Albibacillus kandeliae]|uniref:TIGR02302 family protein n=1 Tax=Albibacillus kandeliae TaxID=2174228 RepID=UPI000D68B3D7|nr:TIGR02302 family protein [Albibacillus kandeliae]
MANPIGTDPAFRKLRFALALTRAGLVAERLLRCFWPLISILLLSVSLLMLGLHDMARVEVVWGVAVVAILAALAALVYGVMRFRWPSRAETLTRLDETMPGRPIQALLDDQAIGQSDPASAAVWRAHQMRMAARASTARAPQPNLRIARRDPYALRYMAVLAFAVALLFGSVWRVGTVAEMTPGSAEAAGGPSWEGWIEPPRYTGMPTVYLADVKGDQLNILQGSRVTLRFYGAVGALTLNETVSGRIGELPAASDPVQDFVVTQNGKLAIDGSGGWSWSVRVTADARPEVSVSGAAEAEADGQMKLAFAASDDYGVVAGSAHVMLDLDAVDRRYGLAAEPDAREGITVPLPMPIAGDRSNFTETLIEDFSKNPWANLPVTFTLEVEDASGQKSEQTVYSGLLPGRRFFDPMAAAVIEQRRDLLWSLSNAPRVAQMLRAVSHRPDDVFRSETAYLRLRVILRRLETFTEYGLRAAQQDEIADAMWDLAILLEEGDLTDALERLRRAQERLSEAMKNGASDEEIADLMQELREATNEYMRQLSRQAQDNGDVLDQNNLPQDMMQMSQNDLQRMMDRIQELMEQGRMAEAQQALQELQQMMENMRITNAPGQGSPSQGQQAMEGLADTLREQQGLSDEAFRDLQEQFNPGAQAGESQGNQGRNGGQGRGQSHEGQGGQGQAQNQGEGSEQSPGGNGNGDLGESLAERQRALRQELERQKGGMPGTGTPEGDAAREALDRAGRAMDGAERALRDDRLADAIDQQSDAMEALREGMRSLGEAMAQQQRQPGQGTAESRARSGNRDPLGRSAGSEGALGSDENLLQGEDVYRRARELLDEIRRRTGDGARPQLELDYLERLLDRF